MVIFACAFCDRVQGDVRRMVRRAHKATAICDDCVVRCVEVLVRGRDEPDEPAAAGEPPKPQPHSRSDALSVLTDGLSGERR